MGSWPLLGARTRDDGVEFRVWAPAARDLAVRVRGREHRLEPEEGGRFAAVVEAAPGDDYVFVLDGHPLPDPCSRFQPEGVRGPSRVVEPTRGSLLGVPLDELVIYELHVGAFSASGTFDGVVERLPGLRELGVTAIEVMPIATFPGERNWGYDGVYAYAPHPVYGGPDGFARLVEAAHDVGLGVILDAVYNHLGPGAEAIAAFGPYFTDRHSTFWGDAIDYAQRGVREWAIQNAEMWVRDYGVDGLRLDATHAIFDDSRPHVLAELAERVRAVDERVLVIAEMETGDLRPIEEWGLDAQWADELHHLLHVLLTGEREGYYGEYGSSVVELARQLERRPPERLVVCSQNHDQVGNRALGDRPATDELRSRAATVLFAPQTPLLFMGEEYGERRPFQFFTDHIDPSIAEATREGRRREFERFSAFSQEQVPDPQDPATFERSKLRPEDGDPELLAFYTELLALRRGLPRELEVDADEEPKTLRIRRGAAELQLDFGARTVGPRVQSHEEGGFEGGDALLVVDVLSDFAHDDAASLLASFHERGTRMAEVIAGARQAGVPVVYVNDDRDRWDSNALALAREAAEGPGGDVVRRLLPQPGDRVLLKHRYSAFDHTALELLLESLGTERVVLVGAATEGCVVQTAIDAREHGLKATIVADACATADPQLEETALRYAEDVGGIRVRAAAAVVGSANPETRNEGDAMTAIQEQLASYLADAHSIEEQALQQLRSAPQAAGDAELATIFKEHLVETEGHEQAMRDRLEAHGEDVNRLKDLLMRVGGAGFVLFAKAQPDTPGKLVAHAYSYEHLELASYELLMRVAERAGDSATVEQAQRIRDEERAMGERLAASFDRAVEASLAKLGPDDLDEQLSKYLADAHAIEAQAIKLLEKAPDSAEDPELAKLFREHLQETREHQRLVGERLDARGAQPSGMKDQAMRAGALSWATFFELHPDTPGKLVAFAYAFEHLEIAAYEELKRVAQRAGDTETIRVADEILAQERMAADKLAASFDRAAETALREVGASRP